MKLKRSHKIALLLLSFVLFIVWVESEQRFVVKGRVVDASTGEPIHGASVAISWSGTHIAALLAPYASGYYKIEQFKTISDEEGYFEIPKYFFKSFYLGVYKKGYVCWSSNNIFVSGLNIKEKKNQVKKRIWFWIRPYMKIKLEPFTEEYSRMPHASFVYNVSDRSGGLDGIGEEIQFYMKRYNIKQK